MTPIHITASGLRDLLTPVLPFVDKSGFPILASIRLRGHGDHITAQATDRYRAAVKRAKVKAAPFEAALPVDAAKSILATFKPTRTHNPDLTLTFTDTHVSVEADGIGGMFDATVKYRLAVGEYPSLDWLFTEAADATPVPLEQYYLNAHFLADFAKAAGASGEHMRLHVGERIVDEQVLPGALFVSIGDDFRGILMPARREDDKALIDETWRGLLTDERVAS